MSIFSIVFIALLYVLILFGVAWWVDKNAHKARRLIDHPYIYALSLAVYCTAWTFFGSVGRASTAGLSFLAVYIGPALFAPLWYQTLYKMIVIAKNERVTSIADFISSRYGKSATVGILVTLMVVLGIIPYISIQIQAVNTALNTLANIQQISPQTHQSPFADTGLYITAAMAIFTAVFGTRKLDPNERHEGLMASIAFEGLIKLFAFLVAGVTITFFLFDGFGDLFSQAAAHPDITRLFSFSTAGTTAFSWTMVSLLSLIAVVLLPRQFHVAVVENNSPRHVRQAMWLFPLYLFLINIFVLPIAVAGKMLLAPSVSPDTYILSLPMAYQLKWVAALVFLGGFSAAISMVVIETTSLSIMLSNHIFVPLLIQFGRFNREVAGDRQILNIRRFAIILILILAYIYERSVTASFDIVSIGLISFAAVAQLAPATFLGMYWRKGNSKGAIAGMIVGFTIWAFCLPLPSMARAGVISSDFITNGLYGISLLKPYALFGVEGLDPITHGGFWSLLLNVFTYVCVSEWTSSNLIGLNQADRFVNVHKYISGERLDPMPREASLSDLKNVLDRFLGEQRTVTLLKSYEAQIGRSIKDKKVADTGLVRFAEAQLTGVIGAASARVVINGIAETEQVSFDEVIRILEQTREAVEYSRVVESKNSELQELTNQLRLANDQLRELDLLKADFITSVTHELRTPVTSIMAFSKILREDRALLTPEKESDFLNIIVHECERITRLINQVLDIEKIQSEHQVMPRQTISMHQLVSDAVDIISPSLKDKEIKLNVKYDAAFAEGVIANQDQILQVLINLLSNAVKFCPQVNGQIDIAVFNHADTIQVDVADNGPGIKPSDEAMIFEKFTQVRQESGKTQGTGLGLYISRKIIQLHSGRLWVTGRPGLGAIFHISLPLSKPIELN